MSLVDNFILRIDVCDVETGEVVWCADDIWIGDYKKVYTEISERYYIVKVDRDLDNDCRTIWVEQG